MGISVRGKVKNSGVFWLFIRHDGQRVAQQVGDLETAEDAAKEIKREIRTGRFDIAAMKAARAAEKQEVLPVEVLTLKNYYVRKDPFATMGSHTRAEHVQKLRWFFSSPHYPDDRRPCAG